MELELGLKLTRIADDFTSDFQLAKDHAGPLFLSHETETMFLLTVHLKGYKRTNIKIDINEDGSLMAISGEKQVQETVIVGWRVFKKDTETKGFKKVFIIPEGVILDRIKAKFDDDESTLTVSMPKKVKGIRGTAVKEVEENQELVKEGSGNLQIADEKIQTTETLRQEQGENSEARHVEQDEKSEQMETRDMEQSKPITKDDRLSEPKDPDLNYEEKVLQESVEESMSSLDKDPHIKTEIPKQETENRKTLNYIQESDEPKHDQQQEQANGDNATERDDNAARVDEPETVKEHEEKHPENMYKICTPIIASSALLLSLAVFVFHIIRSKNQTNRRKD